MADHARKTRKIQDLVELSRYWHAEDMLRNLQEEMRRMEQGLSHMVWDAQMRRVTQCPNPLPVTPRFETHETDDELMVEVQLGKMPEDNISLRVTPDRVDVYARLDERVCRPYFLSVEVIGPLDPDSAGSKLRDGVLEVTVKKVKKVRVKVQ